MGLFSRPPKSTSAQDGQVSKTFTISGMHCTSCAMNIDGELEDLPGVSESTTNYAKAVTKVTFDSKKVDESTLVKTIEGLGYQVQE